MTAAASSLCALMGHDLRATAENGPGVFWLVPPARCQNCGAEFHGHAGIPPANRKRSTGYSSRAFVKDPYA